MSTKTYYRISVIKHDRGEIMRGRGKRPLEEKEAIVEEILNRYRPVNCPDRGDSVYMREDREFNAVGVAFYEGYVHKVEAIGNVYQRDTTWIGMLQMRHHKVAVLRKDKCPELSDAELAEKYWNGAASKTPAWEWVANQARVIEVEDLEVRVRPSGGLIDIFDIKPPPVKE